MERKLVTIRKVRDIEPIVNADMIELCKVDGWQVVVKKEDHFSIGDDVLFFEIDSFLPIDSRFEFLRKSSYKKLADGTEGFRLRTVKLRGTLSQGLVLPIKNFPEIEEQKKNWKVGDYAYLANMDSSKITKIERTCVWLENMNGDDVSTDLLEPDLARLLNVTKYEPPIPVQLNGICKGIFPWFIQKSDQERIQNLPDYFKTHENTEFEVTEKLDGTSATYYLYRNENGEKTFGVCTRTLEYIPTDTNVYSRLGKELDVEATLRKYGRSLALQGEIIGEGVQGNPYKLKGQHFYLYDIYDIELRRYQTPSERLCTLKALDNKKINHVPLVFDNYKVFEVCKTIDGLLTLAKGKSVLNKQQNMEGLVFKSEKVDSFTLNTISFKVINNDYLLEEKD